MRREAPTIPEQISSDTAWHYIIPAARKLKAAGEGHSFPAVVRPNRINWRPAAQGLEPWHRGLTTLSVRRVASPSGGSL